MPALKLAIVVVIKWMKCLYLSTVRKWDCPSCGTMDIDRDLNAALNIRDKGILELKAAGLPPLLMEAA